MWPAAITLNYSVENIRNDVRQKIIIIMIIILYEKSQFDSLVWGSLTLTPIILNCLAVFCSILSVFHSNLSALHTNLSAFQYGCMHFPLNKQTIFLQWINITYVSLSSLSAVTILNTAPGLKGLSQEYFQNTDILCLNETEVSLIYNLIHYAPALRIHVYIPGCTYMAKQTSCFICSMYMLP